MSLRETLFIVTHPKAALEAKLRQVEVAIEAGGPPAGATIEGFVELPVSEATALISAARKKGECSSGVQLKDWSKEDQARMLKGERPKGVPIHRNL